MIKLIINGRIINYINYLFSEPNGMFMRGSVDSVLKRIMADAHEDEIIEFKDRRTLGKDDVGKYFSALSNEANLLSADSSWLIFGVRDDGEIVNSNYLDTVDSQNELKRYIGEQTSGNLTFIGIHERSIDGRRVVLLEIPPAINGSPTSFKGFAYERRGESLAPLSDYNRMRIMGESAPDWSAKIVKDASMDDIDPDALAFARKKFIQNRPSLAEECGKWDDETFLDKMDLRRNGMMTNAALLLLGKHEAVGKMDIPPAGMRWVLRDKDNAVMDSEVYGLPFLCSVEHMCKNIRNLKYSVFLGDDLTKTNFRTYDESLLREALYNCICHQDYTKTEFITLTEMDNDRLIFDNAGFFLPGDPGNVIRADRPTGFYRNRFLANAMRRLCLVEIAGGGIIMMCRCQMKRLFPLPDFDTSEGRVTVTVVGHTTDEAYASILRRRKDIALADVAVLDAIVKGRQVPERDLERLAERGLISDDGGRVRLVDPRFDETGSSDGPEDVRAEILRYLSAMGPSDKKAILNYLKEGALAGMSDDKAYYQTSNALNALRKNGSIVNKGTSKKPIYVIGDSEGRP